MSLTKALRWDIQSLAVRLSKAASAEEDSRRTSNGANTGSRHKAELRFIVADIKRLLLRIEDAVPLINLAITTSGASLSTSLPATVSPSRLLQASTFLTAGDTQYSLAPNTSVQVGPAFTLSLYMLFAGHAHRAHIEEPGMRDTTWKEVIHKARVKLIRVPLATYGHGVESLNNQPHSPANPGDSPGVKGETTPLLPGEGRANEFAYQLEIIEDLDDDRVHSFEDDEAQPGPFKDVLLAGIRELVPIHQVSKIFYADTGKILNIGNEGEANTPVLLFKRDMNALPPRRMMEHSDQRYGWQQETEEVAPTEDETDDGQSDIDHQLRRESSVHAFADDVESPAPTDSRSWRFPPNLDPEWLAFEVYSEADDGSSVDDQEENEDSAYVSRPTSRRKASSDSNFTSGLAQLNLNSPAPTSISRTEQQLSSTATLPMFSESSSSPFGPIRSSLSLLEMLVRLTALQQFQQASHLAIPDELLTFFLEESSTTGAGGDGDERRRKRYEARMKVGFDPYDESPVKRRGEDYQYQNQSGETYVNDSRAGTPYYDHDSGGWYHDGPRLSIERSGTPQSSPEPWLRNREYSAGRRQATPGAPSSPQTPYMPSRRAMRPLDRVQQAGVYMKNGSPLGRERSAETDSSLGTSPASPTLRGNVHHGKSGDRPGL